MDEINAILEIKTENEWMMMVEQGFQELLWMNIEQTSTE